MFERRPVVTIDCDDVLTSTAPKVMRHYNATYGVDVDIAYFYSDNAADWYVTHMDEVHGRIREYFQEYAFAELLEPEPEAIEGVMELADYGCEMHIITGRSDFMAPITEAMADMYFPGCFQAVHHTNDFSDTRRTKGGVFLQVNGDIHIDDNVGHCENIVTEANGISLLRTRPWNQSADLLPGITRCHDWKKIVREVMRIAER